MPVTVSGIMTLFGRVLSVTVSGVMQQNVERSWLVRLGGF